MSGDVPPERPDGPKFQPPAAKEQRSLSARAAALRVLANLKPRRGTARDQLELLLKGDLLSAQELGLANELIMGVLRHRLTLARILGHFTKSEWKRVNRMIQHVLLIGAYQLLWLDGIPPFAAVNEAVEQAKATGGARAGRFVNAVLRQLLREIEEPRIAHSQSDPARSIPINQQYSCQFKRAVLPDPKKKAIEHLADVTSHPLWLVSRWVAAYGLEQATAICRAGLGQPPVFLRPNPLRTNTERLAGQLNSEGVTAKPTADGKAVVVTQPGSFIRGAAFAEGWFQPQDRTAMEVVAQMSLSAGQVVIDLCAGVGTKTTQMAEMMNNTGTILACDKEEAKLASLRDNCVRLGHTIVQTVLPSEIESKAAGLASIDWILVDVPCSNTGVLARRPEARYRVNRRTLEALTSTQLELLKLAGRLARANTRVLYSTCSIEPEENEDISTSFGRAHPEWQLSASKRSFPTSGPDPEDFQDGGYWAIWVRK